VGKYVVLCELLSEFNSYILNITDFRVSNDIFELLRLIECISVIFFLLYFIDTLLSYWTI
jgi:hypothetical protein